MQNIWWLKIQINEKNIEKGFFINRKIILKQSENINDADLWLLS